MKVVADRTLKPVPPTDNYELHGWHCIYHEGWCHNPLDCDLVPVWRLKREVAIELLSIESMLDEG